jgi:hypothetical protein
VACLEYAKNGGGTLMDSAERKYTIETAYRNAFGLCSPSIFDFPQDAICSLCLNALTRGSPVTDEELQVWIEKNSPPTKP